MSIIGGVNDYISDHVKAGIDAKAPVWVNYLRENPKDFSIVPLGGSRKVSEYISGNSGEREFIFALQANFSTADEAARVGNQELFESLAEWLDDQTELENLPTLPAGFTAQGIEALSYGYLWQQGSSQIGIYQIQCRLEYSKQ